jgi:signal peptidase II
VGAAEATGRSARAEAWRAAAFVLAAVVVLDQVTKALVVSGIAPGQERAVVPGVLKLVHVRNHGVAFGFFSGGGAIVLAATAAALALLVAYFARHPERALLWLPTGLLLGGAIGNLIDRLRTGAVTDFIDLPLWPSFNLADVAITAGVISLLVVLERGARG